MKNTPLSKVLCALVIATLPSIAIADMRSSTGNPLLDFYTVYGAIDSVKIICELCNKKYPEYKEQNNRAYNSWRSRNIEFIHKIKNSIMTQ